jgi:mono/diheme cytochrome c family protein
MMRPILVTALCLAATLPALAQNSLPPGPGRDETLKACGGCHGVDIFLGIRRNEGEWETTMQNMINFGMTISDADYDAVLAYLTASLGLKPPPPAPAASP